MAAKPRVHEVAAELGIDSKIALAKLKEMGEFVKGPSSSIEPPVARKLKAALLADGVKPVVAEAPKAAPKAAPKPMNPTPPPAAPAVIVEADHDAAVHAAPPLTVAERRSSRAGRVSRRVRRCDAKSIRNPAAWPTPPRQQPVRIQPRHVTPRDPAPGQ